MEIALSWFVKKVGVYPTIVRKKRVIMVQVIFLNAQRGVWLDIISLVPCSTLRFLYNADRRQNSQSAEQTHHESGASNEL